LDKGAGLWLIVGPFIPLFHITHFIFTSVLHFHFDLIQLSASNIFTRECGHGLNASNMHLACCPFGGQQIAAHDAIKDIMYVFV